MTISRIATIGLVCLFAGACTVVVQPAAKQPQPEPPATEQDPDVEVTSPEPVRRPPARVPTTGPTNPEPDPVRVEPRTPSRRPAPRPTRSNRLNLGVPPGHLPGPGECRVWVQGLAPGQQARARSCSGILAAAPVGSWILYRPAQYERQVRVRYLHATRRMVIAVRAFDAETGEYLRDYALAEDDDNMAPVAVAVRRPTARPGNDRPVDRGNSGNAPGRVGDDRDKGNGERNNGVAVGRRDTAGDTSSVENNRGNQGSQGRPDDARANASNRGCNASNQGGSARDQGNGGGNNGVAVGRRDTAGDTSSVENNRGNQGAEGRPSNARANAASRVKQKPAAAATVDSTAGSRATGRDTGGADAGNDDSSRRRQAASSVRGGVRDVDSPASAPAEREDPSGSVRRGDGLDDRSAGDEERASLGINPRFLPDAGECRIWVQGLPYGRQAKARSCNGIVDEAPAGAWILRRSLSEPDVVNVDYVDDENAGSILRTGVFDVESGLELRGKRH